MSKWLIICCACVLLIGSAQAQLVDPPKIYINSIGMRFTWISPGNFIMGSPKNEEQRFSDEDQHKVTLTKGFYIGVYPVTQEEWENIMGSNPSHFKNESRLPVETVSWNDCQEFIKKLQGKDNKMYRLPTEAEWEYSCRANTTSPFYFGQTLNADQCNYRGTGIYQNGIPGVYRKKTTPVGTFPANAWGLCDMHGNVLEWCNDRYGKYDINDVIDPQGQQEPNMIIGFPKKESRVLRGGSWFLDPAFCRSSVRGRYNPVYRHSSIGLRVCFFVK